MNVVITDDLLMLKCYTKHLHASQILKLKSKYLRSVSSLMFHLALSPCRQSLRSTSRHPNWALRNRRHCSELLRKEKINSSMYYCDLQGQLCHAMPRHARLHQASRLSPLPSLALGLCQPCPGFFFLHLLLHPSLSLSPPSIWRDSFRAGPWSPSAHSHLIKRSHSTV